MNARPDETENSVPEQERVVGYNEVTVRTAAQRSFLHNRLPVTLSLKSLGCSC